MPITPRYDWDQDFNTISIRIYGPGFRPDQLQVADLFLGLNSAPYLLGLDFYHAVESEQCEVRVLPSAMHIQLRKKEQGLWPELCIKADPEQLRCRRKDTLSLAQLREEEKRKCVLQEKSDSKAKAQKRVWEEEDQHRSQIDQLKQKEEDDAKADLDHWAKLNENRSLHSSAEKNLTFNQPEGQADITLKPIVEVVHEGDHVPADSSSVSRVAPVRHALEEKQRLPGVRNNEAVYVRFTAINDRAGPVARDPNEDDEFAVIPPIADGTDDITEGHVQLLFEKGLKFQKSNDYLSAVSAFTSVLHISTNDALSLSNRARCYLKLAQFRGAALGQKFERLRKCVADCNLVLAGKCPSQVRADVLRTRAQANALLGNFPSSISDYEDAEYFPGTDTGAELISELKDVISRWNRQQAFVQTEDVDQIYDINQISDLIKLFPCKIDYLFRRAQIYSGHGDHNLAIDDLTECLAIVDDPVLVRQLSNDTLDQTIAKIYQLRGAGHLDLQHLKQAGDDLSSALQHGMDREQVQPLIAIIQQRISTQCTRPESDRPSPESEKDPLQSLMDSAAESFQSGDAVRAKRLYGEALRLNPPLEIQARILSNRAATELCLQQYDACIRDSTSSLELGIVSDPIRRATTLSRRAAAYSGMGSRILAQEDLKAAISLLEPGSVVAQQIAEDLKRLDQ